VNGGEEVINKSRKRKILFIAFEGKELSTIPYEVMTQAD
jgi:hypothetical protein